MEEAPEAPEPTEEKKKKKKDKVRSAWISFAGRIVAQIVGAAATIILGLLVVQKYASRDDTRAERTSAEDTGVTPRARRGTEKALAVLPLQNFSGNRDEEYFVDGMTEALIASLAQIEHLQVISRTSSMQYKEQRKPLPEIARELGVDLILEGSVARSGERVRVTTQLIDATADQHLWARTYDRTMRDVLSLQTEVAAAVAREINLTISSVTQAHFAQNHQAVDPAAYELYLKGRQAWNLRTADGFRQAITYFDQAIQKDASFALPYAGLADTYSLSGPYNLVPGSENRPARAKAAAQRALELDEHLGEAHASLAAVLHREEANVEAAEREFKRALELNPGYATAHQWYALLLAEEQRDEEATRHAQQAVALDPLSGTIHQTLGLVHYYARRYDRAVTSCRRALELAPHLTLARAILARALLLQGHHAAAIDVYQQAGARGDPDLVSTVSVAYRRAGDAARADALLQSLLSRHPLPTAPLAKWYALTRDHDSAYRMLEQVLADRMSLQQIKSDPVFDGIRGEARFAALVQRGASR